MKRIKYKVSKPRENLITRDYWELLQVDLENRVECTNTFLYENVTMRGSDRASQLREISKLQKKGWKLYESIYFEDTSDTITYKLMKVITRAMNVLPGKDASVFEVNLSEPVKINEYAHRHTDDIESTIEPKVFHYDDFSNEHESPMSYEDLDSIQEQNEADKNDMQLVDTWMRVVDKRVRDKVRGKKVYDEWEWLGKKQCAVGAHSFITKHCTQPVYRDKVCYYHWMQLRHSKPGFNPALPGESLHTVEPPYIPSIDEDLIFDKMLQYVEATEPITPAALTPKKPRCKHLLYEDECSICLGKKSIKPDGLEGLPEETDTFMVIDY